MIYPILIQQPVRLISEPSLGHTQQISYDLRKNITPQKKTKQNKTILLLQDSRRPLIRYDWDRQLVGVFEKSAKSGIKWYPYAINILF